MEELKTQIQHESSLAANYARQAKAAFAELLFQFCHRLDNLFLHLLPIKFRLLYHQKTDEINIEVSIQILIH